MIVSAPMTQCKRQPFLDRALSSPILGRGLIIAGHGSGTRGSRYIAVRPGGAQAGAKPELAYELKDDIPPWGYLTPRPPPAMIQAGSPPWNFTTSPLSTAS